MHNLRHFYYQNKQKIWKVILIIALILALIQILNKLESSRNLELSSQVNTGVSSDTNIYEDSSNKTYISNQSAINGGSITEEEVSKVNDTVSKFLQYCKNEDAENAYNMLSNDCKEVEFSTLEIFKQKYVNTRFNKNSIYEIQNWINNTYKISISEDKLATGNVNSNQKQIEYITIVEESGENKLNINSYIGKQNINKETTKNDVKISVTSKNVYLDYEVYNFKIENLSNKTIKLDSLEKTNTMYIKDESGNRYNAYSHEILGEELELKSKRDININIKYNNTYSDKKTIKNIVFDNVILDYVEYKQEDNVENFTKKCNIQIAI